MKVLLNSVNSLIMMGGGLNTQIYYVQSFPALGATTIIEHFL